MSNDQFRSVVQQPDDQIDLAYAALLFARDAFPDLDPQPYLKQLDRWAEDVRPRLTSTADPIDVLNTYLFDQVGLKGNVDDYHNPLNNYLNQVIDRRLGLPITLSLIYTEVARRLDLPVVGIGLPGHFIVRYAHGDDARYLDPFHRGCVLSVDDCRRLVTQLTQGKLKFHPGLLSLAGPHQILIRMLYNLKNAYLHQGQFASALPVVERLRDLTPNDPSLMRDMGLLHYQLDHPGTALEWLRQYLARATPLPDDPVRQIIAEIQTKIARMN